MRGESALVAFTCLLLNRVDSITEISRLCLHLEEACISMSLIRTSDSQIHQIHSPLPTCNRLSYAGSHFALGIVICLTF